MNLKTVSTLTMLTLSPLAMADYQVEVALANLNLDLDGDIEVEGYDLGDTEIKNRSNTINATYYFESVPTQGVPLSLADYLAHASSVSIEHDRRKIDTDVHIEFSVPGYGYSYKYLSDETDKTTLTKVDTRYVTQNSQLIFQLSLGRGSGDVDVSKSELEIDGSIIQLDRQSQEKYGYDVDFYALGFGGYISDTASLTLNYSGEKSNYDTPYGDDKDKSVELSYENVILDEDSTAIWYKVGVQRESESSDLNEDTDTNTVSAWFSYYPNHAFQVGIGLDLVRGDLEGQSLTLYAEGFVTENLALSVAYFDTSLDSEIDFNVDQKADGSGVGFLARFRF